MITKQKFNCIKKLTFLVILLSAMLFNGCKKKDSFLPKGTAKEITRFDFTETLNSALDKNYVGVINGLSIAVAVPYGTDVTKLKPTIEVSAGATISSSKKSEDENDFSSTQTYTVKAQDNSTQDYKITVTKATADDITLYSWKLKSVTKDGVKSTTPTTDINGSTISIDRYKLVFGKNSSFTFSLSINAGSATYSIPVSETITITGYGTTKICCDSEFDILFAQAFPKISSYQVSANILTLKGGNYEMEFEKE